MSQPVEARYPVNTEFDPLDEEYLADPYPHFARFREEAPIFYAPKKRCCGRSAARKSRVGKISHDTEKE